MLKNCLTCNTEFFVYLSEIRKGGGKYCSKKCHENRNGGKIKNECLVCKKQFEVTPHLSSTKYCSRKCYSKLRKSTHAPNYNSVERKCLVCQKVFTVIPAKIKAGKGKFCSKKCYLVDHSKNTFSVGTCLGCGKKFRYHTYRHQTCCSLGCNTRWRKIKNKDKKYSQKKCLWCKKETEVLKSREKDNRGGFCSKKCYSLWMSKNRIGKNCPSWRGGLTSLYRRIRTLARYYEWRKEILRRDGYQCMECGEKETNKLIVDHIKGLARLMNENNIKNTTDANNCILLWDINNGRVLCKKCHVQTENYGANGRVNKLL